MPDALILIGGLFTVPAIAYYVCKGVDYLAGRITSWK